MNFQGTRNWVDRFIKIIQDKHPTYSSSFINLIQHFERTNDTQASKVLPFSHSCSLGGGLIEYGSTHLFRKVSIASLYMSSSVYLN